MSDKKFRLVCVWLLLVSFYIGYNEWRFRKYEARTAESAKEILEGIREIKQIIERTNSR